MSSPVKVPITISGDNIDLTPALSDYLNEKVDRTLGKLSAVSGVSNCDVFLTVNKNPKVKEAHPAEVVTSIKGTTFRVAETSPDMYASIDLVANRLARKLRNYKERRLNGYHGGPNMGENLADVLNSIEVEDEAPVEDEDIDPEQAVVTKVKSFDLSNAISVKEAIFHLTTLIMTFTSSAMKKPPKSVLCTREMQLELVLFNPSSDYHNYPEIFCQTDRKIEK